MSTADFSGFGPLGEQPRYPQIVYPSVSQFLSQNNQFGLERVVKRSNFGRLTADLPKKNLTVNEIIAGKYTETAGHSFTSRVHDFLLNAPQKSAIDAIKGYDGKCAAKKVAQRLALKSDDMFRWLSHIQFLQQLGRQKLCTMQLEKAGKQCIWREITTGYIHSDPYVEKAKDSQAEACRLFRSEKQCQPILESVIGEKAHEPVLRLPELPPKLKVSAEVGNLDLISLVNCLTLDPQKMLVWALQKNRRRNFSQPESSPSPFIGQVIGQSAHQKENVKRKSHAQGRVIKSASWTFLATSLEADDNSILAPKNLRYAKKMLKNAGWAGDIGQHLVVAFDKGYACNNIAVAQMAREIMDALAAEDVPWLAAYHAGGHEEDRESGAHLHLFLAPAFRGRSITSRKINYMLNAYCALSRVAQFLRKNERPERELYLHSPQKSLEAPLCGISPQGNAFNFLEKINAMTFAEVPPIHHFVCWPVAQKRLTSLVKYLHTPRDFA